ncbi:hypothetical protein ACFLUK_03080, partial [Chloroflexota bacterium]
MNMGWQDILVGILKSLLCGFIGLVIIYSIAYILAVITIELPFTRKKIYRFLNKKNQEFHYEG